MLRLLLLFLILVTNFIRTKAEELAEQMERDSTKIITTRAVLLEIGNALGKQSYRAGAVALLQALEADVNVEIMPLTEDLFEHF